jgi:hypothetical protein
MKSYSDRQSTMSWNSFALRVVLFGICIYGPSYFFLRSHSASYAPYAWNRGYETVNPTPNTIHYPIFGSRPITPGPPPSMARLKQEFLEPLAYYVFSPLVELDLAINNHPANPLPEWTFYGNNWPK